MIFYFSGRQKKRQDLRCFCLQHWTSKHTTGIPLFGLLGDGVRVNVGSSSDDESSDEKDTDVLKIYNEAMTNIASLTGRKVAPLTFRLATEWEKAAANEKAVCLDQVDEACRAVCNVIAPRDSEKLLQAFQDSKTTEVCSDDLTSLITAYKHAPTRNLKTQILSIYAPRYSARF